MEPEETMDNNSIESTDTQIQYVERTREMVATTATRSWVEGDPYLRIIQQPHPTIYRFRYKSEGRLAGSIPGINSTENNKTFPTIEVVNFKGYIEIVVSCVTVEKPYLQHPHNLVSKKGSKYGVYCLPLKGPIMQASLSNVGIRCVKKDDVAQSLRLRKKVNFDPFGGGLKNEDYEFNLSAVRLCFQGFIPTAPGSYHKLPPIVSDPITDKKHVYKLEIVGLCSCSDKAAGGAQIYMFCSPLSSADVKIRFYEVLDGNTIWESYAKFEKVDIHLKCGIRFKTPPYRNLDIEQPVKVFLQLERLSSEASTSSQPTTLKEYSQPLPFDYYPDPERIKRLRLERRNVDWGRIQRSKVDNVQSAVVNCDNVFGVSNRQQSQGLGIQSSLHLNIPAVINHRENTNEGYKDDDSMSCIPSDAVTFERGNIWNSESMQKVMYMWNSQNLKTSQQSAQHPLHQPDPSSYQSQNQKQPTSPQILTLLESQLQQQPILRPPHDQSQQQQTQITQVYHTTPLKTLSLSDELEDIFEESRQRLQDIEPNYRYLDPNLQIMQQNSNQFVYQQESNQQFQSMQSSQEQETPRQTLQQCKPNSIQGHILQQPQMHESQQKLPTFQALKHPYHQSEYFQQPQSLQVDQDMPHSQLNQQLMAMNYPNERLQHQHPLYNNANESNNF